MHRRSLLALSLASPFLARGAAARTAVPVVASFSILGDMVRQLGGERVALRVLAGPDVDAHAFQPRPSDAGAIRGARLVVRNGLGFDPWLDRLVRSAGYAGPVATASEGISPRRLEEHGHGHDHDHAGEAVDPHAWQDLRHGQAYARNIARALAEADPAGAEIYRRRAEAYLARLEALDAWVRAQIASVPEERRRVVTSHDAFGYFGAAYGVRFLAPQGVSTDSEPSAAQVARLIRLLRQEGITAVFLENMANPATLRRLAAEAKVTMRGRLYADALSAPDGPAPDYEAMFRHNLGLLVPAMRGEG
ncbi:metal ABC transporter substrate-binding protein [Roseomonas marmotae]|uniref:Metal ABC transporter substrate-binding protein n=1 Tax=Roseomonas marmotae TaxID=2768161 RepID=A0ABS3KCH6_9PROT|nr:metal ABC transporter substrate-binding protein [Roseomonas marmotae]MBO1075178.1 metal ABC transporter substrate-binding protein [Roseomonas marmotae]QTI79713.1 metal ABC transporter substrate-binding protein [Roseomonas marmotae]